AHYPHTPSTLKTLGEPNLHSTLHMNAQTRSASAHGNRRPGSSDMREASNPKGTCVDGAVTRSPVEAPIRFCVTAREDCGNRARSRTSRHAVLSVLAAQSGAGTGIRDAAPSTQVPFGFTKKD